MIDLPRIPVERVLSVEQADALVGDDLPEKAPTVTTAGLYVDAETDEPIYAYLPMERRVAELRRACLAIRMSNTLRSTGVNNISRTFGMAPRKAIMRRESCRPSNLAIDQPDEHRVLVDLADDFARLLSVILPAVYAEDLSYVEKILPEWRMSDETLWTSGVVNRSSTLPYHRDSANFPTWSAMPVVRRGMAGGYLDVPEYGLTVECRDGWVTAFLGQRLVHGVTPMHPRQPDAYRYSVVYYALRGMQDCFTHAIEQRRGTAKRTEREAQMGLPKP